MRESMLVGWLYSCSHGVRWDRALGLIWMEMPVLHGYTILGLFNLVHIMLLWAMDRCAIHWWVEVLARSFFYRVPHRPVWGSWVSLRIHSGVCFLLQRHSLSRAGSRARINSEVAVLWSPLQLGSKLILRNVADLPIVYGVELLNITYRSCCPTSIEATISSLIVCLMVILMCTLAMNSGRIDRGLVADLLIVSTSGRAASKELLLLSDLVLVLALWNNAAAIIAIGHLRLMTLLLHSKIHLLILPPLLLCSSITLWHLPCHVLIDRAMMITLESILRHVIAILLHLGHLRS